jgi:hypothetical protein
MAELRLEMDRKFAETLKDLANGGSQAEVIQKAVATYKFLKDQTAGNPGLSVAFADAAGNVQNTILIP